MALNTELSPTTLEAFRQLLGANASADAPALLESFATDHSLVKGVRPSLVVYPQSREQVQAIVRLANDSATPLIPISSGAPHFLGDTVPARGGVVVDFTRMRKVIKLDAYNRMARIEPGVTFGELMPLLGQAGQKLNTPLAPRANKSVVASALEREVPLIPKYSFDFLDPMLTLETVYGTGDDFRTGSAAGPGKVDVNLTADLVNPWGPSAIDYYRFVSAAQGTMGLITWAVIRTEMKPTLHKLFFVALADIDQAWTPVDQLLRKRVVDECLVLDNTTLATLLAANAADIGKLKDQLPPFTLIVGITGLARRPEERVAVYQDYLEEICAATALTPQLTLPGAPGAEAAVAEVLSNPWRREPHWKLRRGEDAHEIFFLCPLSKFPVYVRQMASLVKSSAVPALDLGVYVQPAVQGRGAQVSFTLPFDRANRAAVEALYLSASYALMANGAFFSRPYGPWAKMVYDTYADGADMLRKLKGVFDPAGILNPGKLCF